MGQPWVDVGLSMNEDFRNTTSRLLAFVKLNCCDVKIKKMPQNLTEISFIRDFNFAPHFHLRQHDQNPPFRDASVFNPKSKIVSFRLLSSRVRLSFKSSEQGKITLFRLLLF